jgi:hypothetical protein
MYVVKIIRHFWNGSLAFRNRSDLWKDSAKDIKRFPTVLLAQKAIRTQYLKPYKLQSYEYARPIYQVMDLMSIGNQVLDATYMLDNDHYPTYMRIELDIVPQEAYDALTTMLVKPDDSAANSHLTVYKADYEMYRIAYAVDNCVIDLHHHEGNEVINFNPKFAAWFVKNPKFRNRE